MSVYSDLILAESSLVSYWRLDETSGTAIADAKATNGGVVSGDYTLNQASLLTGDADPSVLFGGTNARVVIADSPSLDTMKSFEAWIKPTDTGAGAREVMVRDSHLVLRQSGADLNVFAYVSFNYRGPAVGTGVLAAGVTSHVVGTYDGTTIRAYHNGIEVATSAYTGTMAASAIPMQIGSWTTAINLFNGVIDEAAFYNTALSPAQVAEHYAAGLQVRRSRQAAALGVG